MRESLIEKKIGDYAISRACLYYKFTSPARPSVPDRLIVTPLGVTGFLEIKAAGKKPTRGQRYELDKLTAQGAPASWVDNVEDGKEFINHLLTRQCS